MTGGRRPLPTVLTVLRGTDRADRVPKEEPKPRLRAPRPPAHVQGLALEEWRRMVKLLRPLKLLTVIDGTALAAYAILYARWVDAEEMVRKYGPVMRSKGTYIQQSPYLSIANKARASMMKILVEFGATPASRSRIDVSALDEEVFR